MDIRARPSDPEVEQLARSIYSTFPKCMRCGEAIESFEEADVRILSHRVVHKRACADVQLNSADPESQRK